MKTLSVVLATFNEEKTLFDCLESVKNLADEIVIVDGTSKDATVDIAKQFGAKILVTQNHAIFHINKQKALELATKDWILQLDADERVSTELAEEIKKILDMSDEEVQRYQESLPNKQLFLRHQKLLEKRDGHIGTKTGSYAAFFVPRLNFFLGRYMKHGGVYPDGVIRLVKKRKAHFPAKSVHEQIVVDGKVGWLQNDLLHMDSPTFAKYIARWHRYTDLIAGELKKEGTKNPITAAKYLFILPSWWFVSTYFRHKGILDSWQGFVFSFFSSLRFPMGYIKAIKK